MKSRKRLLSYSLLIFMLAGCATEKLTPVIQLSQTESIEVNAIPSATNASALPDWCIDLKQEKGLPVTNEAMKLSIVYKAYTFDGEKQMTESIWKVSANDGSNKLITEKFPSSIAGDDKYDIMGNGFSLISADKKHIAIWGHWYESKNTDGTYSLFIQNQENGIRTEIFRSSPGERIDGNWSPDGNYFVFTWYKNIPEYYSVIYSVNSDGTNLRELTDPLKLETLEPPYWSPDGKKIAIPIWGRDGGFHILLINFETGKVSRYKVSRAIKVYSSATYNTMSWSPDSYWFAYISEYEHHGIEILNPDNGNIYCVNNDEIFGAEKLIWQYDSP